MARTAYFEAAVAAVREGSLDITEDADESFAACWPEAVPFPELEAVALELVAVGRYGYRDPDGVPCRCFRLADTGAERGRLRAAGVDDYFETHAQDDLQDFSDNEAWADMQGESGE